METFLHQKLWPLRNAENSVIKPADILMAMMGLFLFRALSYRINNKGPMLWPLLGIFPSLLFNINDLYHWATEVLITCGGIFPYRGLWFERCHGFVTINPSNIEYMLKTRFKNFPKGKYFRERFADLFGDGIFNADDELWKEQRRAAVSEMHSSRYVNHSIRCTEELVYKKLLIFIKKFAKSNEKVDLQEIFLRFTFDSICNAAFGVDTGCLAVDLPEKAFAKAFEEATEFSLLRFLTPPFIWKFMKFLCIGTELKLKNAVQIVHEFAFRTVKERRLECRKLGGLSDKSDLLSRLIESQDIFNNNVSCRFSDELLKDLCLSFILAGRDTSSVGLSWFFWLIYRHPAVEKSILNEILNILRDRKVSINQVENLIFTTEDLDKMEYLHAALSESMRLYPPVPIDFKEAREDDVFPDGTEVKKGDRIMYCIYSMARSEDIWGKDCRDFKPERWMKDGKFKSENQFKYVVFNGGPRLCMGKKFAYMQMKMVAASILLRYSVSVLDSDSVIPKLTTTLYMKNGLQVTFKPRSDPLSQLSPSK